MKRSYKLLATAARELKEAFFYYQAKANGLGVDFINAFDECIRRILEFPETWRKLDEHHHRCLMHRFPFGVIYRMDEDRVVAVSIMHLHRRPGSWRSEKAE